MKKVVALLITFGMPILDFAVQICVWDLVLFVDFLLDNFYSADEHYPEPIELG